MSVLIVHMAETYYRNCPSEGSGIDFGSDTVLTRQISINHQSRHPQHYPLPVFENDTYMPSLHRNASRIDISNTNPLSESGEKLIPPMRSSTDGFSRLSLTSSVFQLIRSGNRPAKNLFILISLNVAYSTVELLIGVLSGRVGFVSDALHLTFGCGLLSFSLISMAVSKRSSDNYYTYGYKRIEVLSAFTNTLFLLFMSFSLAVESLHAFLQDESEHKHYLIVSAVTNLAVNLVGVYFFRNYACINIVYRKAEDMNNHSVCLHVLADSIRSAGLILVSLFLSLGYEGAEVLCLGLVSATVFMMVVPLFKASGGILLQMAPLTIPSSAMNKCWRQVLALECVSEVSECRFWEMVPGYVVGSLSVQVKEAGNPRVLEYVHGLYHELGVQDLTVQIDHI